MTARHKGKFCKVPDGYVPGSWAEMTAKREYERGMKDAPVTTRTVHHYDASPNHYHWGYMLLAFALGVLVGCA